MAAALKMTFDPMTIEHLGVRMYSTLPPVLGELIANAYDADASSVDVELYDLGDKRIIVRDNGSGMSLDDINRKFLRIGRNRREDEGVQVTPGKRKVIGKKGLGKLSFFGIAHEIAVATCKNGKRNSFNLSWDAIRAAAGTQNGLADYQPKVIETDVECEDPDGTIIQLGQIQRESDFDAEGLVNSLARIFICDAGFVIRVSRNSGEPIEVTEERRFVGMNKQMAWEMPDGISVDYDYVEKENIKGVLFATEKPISPRTKMRGITLFSRKKLVNAPEYFSDSASSHFFSYLTGWLEVDFIDDLDDDVIGTNRQSLNWNHPETLALRDYLQRLMRALEVDWRGKRKKKRRSEISNQSKINIENWIGTLPEEVEREVSKIIDSVVDESELVGDEQGSVVRALHSIVPEYPRYHWRHLHKEIQDASKTDYEAKDYYRAFQEAVKRFISKTREKSVSTNTSDSGMMGDVYGRGKVLVVTNGYKKPDGTDFSNDTIGSIEDGQKFLSMGIVAGGRNPVSHEEIVDLRESGLFSEKDCLDGLSLLSHLMRRLDDANVPAE